jgi:hypothetical protein
LKSQASARDRLSAEIAAKGSCRAQYGIIANPEWRLGFNGINDVPAFKAAAIQAANRWNASRVIIILTASLGGRSK